MDKYRIILENKYTHFEDKMRNEVLKKIFNEFSMRKEDKEIYSKLEKAYAMTTDVKNNSYDMEDDY